MHIRRMRRGRQGKGIEVSEVVMVWCKARQALHISRYKKDTQSTHFTAGKQRHGDFFFIL